MKEEEAPSSLGSSKTVRSRARRRDGDLQVVDEPQARPSDRSLAADVGRNLNDTTLVMRSR